MGVPNTTGAGTHCNYKPGKEENPLDLKGNSDGTAEGVPNSSYEPQAQQNRV